MALFKLLITAVVLLQFVEAHIEFKSRIPNGDRVPNPCPEGTFWSGVGHQSPAGANTRNPFGMDFKAAGLQWTADLCRKDSDGDGLTNGQELGDPDCVWTMGATPARMTGLSHPGICPLDSATCKNSWTVCPKAFSCPAMDEAGVTVRNFTINETAVPPKETTYMCQAFEDFIHLGCLLQPGCPVACRNYMNYTLFPSNACFDPKRSLHTLEALHIGSFKTLPRTSMSTFFLREIYPMVKMCQKEIEMLPLLEKLQMSSQGGAVGNTVPPVTCSAVNSSPSLKSEHLLIIIVVCSCLGFALLVAILIFVGRSCNGRLQQQPMLQKDQESVKANVYKVYT